MRAVLPSSNTNFDMSLKYLSLVFRNKKRNLSPISHSSKLERTLELQEQREVHVYNLTTGTNEPSMLSGKEKKIYTYAIKPSLLITIQ